MRSCKQGITPQSGWKTGKARLSTTRYACSLRWGKMLTPAAKQGRQRSKSGHTAHLMRTALLMSHRQLLQWNIALHTKLLLRPLPQVALKITRALLAEQPRSARLLTARVSRWEAEHSLDGMPCGLFEHTCGIPQCGCNSHARLLCGDRSLSKGLGRYRVWDHCLALVNGVGSW